MNNDIKISVIITSYNEIDFIDKAVSSVTSQVIGDYKMEIIIGDDGSDDGSIEHIIDICNQKYENIVFHYFIMDRFVSDEIIPSIRVSNVLKRALDLACGDYIACISADDYFCDDNKLINAILFLDNNPLYCSYVTSYKKVGAEENIYNIKHYNPFAFLSLDYIHISCFVFRHISSDNLLPRFCDDIGMEYTLSKMGKWKFDNNITFAYMQREGSIMHASRILENRITDVMLYQDIINDSACGMFLHSTRARLFRSFLKVFILRKSIRKNKSLCKYFDDCRKYENDYLNLITSFDDISFAKKMKIISLLLCMFTDRLILQILIVFFRIRL